MPGLTTHHQRVLKALFSLNFKDAKWELKQWRPSGADVLKKALYQSYFDPAKAKKQIETLEEEIQGREKDMYDLKHELIAAQIKLENTEKTVKKLMDEANENTRKMLRLEGELSEARKSKG